jgi:hypothetical protein
VNEKGLPLSWEAYQRGVKHIAVERLRDQLALAQAVRLSDQTVEDWDVWQRDMTTLTEVPRNG